MNIFKVRIFSPEMKLSFNKVISLSVNGSEGKIMVLANHCPYIIYLLPGLITIKMNDKKEEKIIINTGILEIINNSSNIITNEIQVLTKNHLYSDDDIKK